MKKIYALSFLFFSAGIGGYSQNIGINTDGSAGQTLLHTKNTTAGLNNYLRIENTQAAQQSALQFLNSGTAGADWIQYIPGGTTDLRFYRGGDKVTFLSNGNVGIGISPSYKLDVYGASGNYPAKVGGPDGYLLFGPANTGWCHFATDRARFYFNTGITVDQGLIGSYAQDLQLQTSGTTRITVLNSNGNVGIGIPTPGYTLDLNSGTFGFGASNSRTEYKDDAGLQGNAGSQSGFFQTSVAQNYPADWPTGASGWWHLIDSRHSNPSNNYALQIAGSFFDQELWFRKTNGNPTTAWTKIITTANIGSYGDNLGNHIATMGIKRNDHAVGFLEGSYNNVGANDSKSNPIYTIGSAYNPTNTSLSNMYGIGYSHSNFWGSSSNMPGGWGQYVAAAGAIRVILEANSGIVWAASDVRAPLFYDINDMTYYLDPNGTSNLNLITNRTKAMVGSNGLYNTPRPTITGDTRYWTGSMGWGTTDFNTIFSNWGGGNFDTWGSPANAPGGSTHYVGMQAMHFNYGDGTNAYGFQLACAGEANNRLFFRSGWPSPRPWVELLHTGNTWGSNMQSSYGTTDVSHASYNTWLNLMSITFTPIHSTVYVVFNAAGSYSGPVGNGMNMNLIGFRLWNVNTGTSICSMKTRAGTYTGLGTINDWTAVLSCPVTVTPGVSTTLNIDWLNLAYYVGGQFNNIPVSDPTAQYRNFVILD